MSIFEELSSERKQLQENGKLPKWFTTLGWQAFKNKYLFEAETYEEQIDRIVENVSRYVPNPEESEYFKVRWKELLMNNHAYLSTPALANNGTNRGLSVSCSGGVIGDSVYDFGASRLEASILSQNGFGTSAYMGEIRHRGSPISRGGTADGVLPVFKDMVQMAENISQGSTRRGAWAGYLPISHEDFDEIIHEVLTNPDGSNIGWNFYDADIAKLNEGDPEITRRFQEVLYVKCVTGKGYIYKPDAVARMQPDIYEILGLVSKASNLCTEITLHSDEEHSYTCVLSGMVATTFNEWKDTDAVFCMTVFLDCLVTEFLELARGIKGLENIVRGTEKSRAIGLGVTGYHSALQQQGYSWGSFQAQMFNNKLFKHLHDESLKASQWMAKEWGEPEWLVGTGLRNSHRTALAPNVSSSLLFGSESQGITPWYGNVYNEGSASGGMFRVNPVFIDILKKYDQYTPEVLDQVLDDNGSVRSLDFLSDEEKNLLLTAFEINQKEIINSVSRRQKYICQGQSCNLFFSADESEEYIAYIHQYALEDDNIKSLYYLRSKAGVAASKGACEACES